MTKKMIRTQILILALAIAMNTSAQDKIVHGVVTTFDSIFIVGAEIRVNSTKEAVLTDSLGNFTVVTNEKDKLRITANGFNRQNVNLDGKQKYVAVNLKLKPGEKNLEIATGFTRLEDRDKLQALHSMNSNDLNLSGYTNIFDALKGKFPGLDIRGTSIIVRGVGSISGPTPALIVLDGVIVNGATLNSIDPETIKSINVIKDGSAAFYGSRGAFGVVEIKTKSGRDSKN